MKKSIIIIGLTFVLLSCTKENFQIDRDNIENISTFGDYLKLVKTDVDGAIVISNVSSIETRNNKTVISSIKKGNTNSFDFIMDNQTVNTNNDSNIAERLSTWNVDSPNLNNFYGSNLKLNLKGNNINASFINNKKSNSISPLNKSSAANTDLYIPELLKVNVSGLANGKVVAGTTFIWNKDTNNKNGIVIGAEYKKQIQTSQIIAKSNPINITRGSTIADNGSYTVTSNDLRNFADNAVVIFSIGRAGYTIINEANTDVIVGAYSIVRTDFNISK